MEFSIQCKQIISLKFLIFMVYFRLSGYPPFDEEKGSVYEQIKEGKIDFSNSIWNEISNSGIQFYSKPLIS